MKRGNRLRNLWEVVDRGAAAVAEVHKQILNMPLTVLEQFPAVAAPAKRVREVQDRVVDGIYGSIRKVNKLVFDAADSLLGPQVEKAVKRPTHPKAAAVPHRRSAAAVHVHS